MELYRGFVAQAFLFACLFLFSLFFGASTEKGHRDRAEEKTEMRHTYGAYLCLWRNVNQTAEE